MEAKSEQLEQLEKAIKEAQAMIPNNAQWVTLPGYVVSLENRISVLENLVDKKIDARFEAFAYALNKRSGLLSAFLSRQLWALFGRLVLLWIILGSVWLAIVLVALELEGG